MMRGMLELVGWMIGLLGGIGVGWANFIEFELKILRNSTVFCGQTKGVDPFTCSGSQKKTVKNGTIDNKKILIRQYIL